MKFSYLKFNIIKQFPFINFFLQEYSYSINASLPINYQNLNRFTSSKCLKYGERRERREDKILKDGVY